MSDLNLTLRLKALGDIAKPFKNLLNTTNKLQQNFDKTRAAASAMQRQLQSITHLRKLRASLAQNSAELAKMRDKTRALKEQIQQTDAPTAKLLKQFKTAAPKQVMTEYEVIENAFKHSIAAITTTKSMRLYKC